MAHKPNNQHHLDLVIIGGGPAGMSAALTAGRARLNTVIINAETPRNAVTTASHGFLTRDGAHPAELLAAAKDQLRKYTTVSYVNDEVRSTAPFANGFQVISSSGVRTTTDRLILATGHVDDLDLLDMPGVVDVYGKSVYPCIFCDGFEHQNERLGLFGREGAIHYAPMVRLWSNDVIVFTNGADLQDVEAQSLEANNIQFHIERIEHLESENGNLRAVILESGERIERDAGFISDEYSHPAVPFATELGITNSPNDWGGTSLDVGATGNSEIAGLYVVGDAHTGFSGIVAAAAEGAACVETIVHAIASERWQ